MHFPLFLFGEMLLAYHFAKNMCDFPTLSSPTHVLNRVLLLLPLAGQSLSTDQEERTEGSSRLFASFLLSLSPTGKKRLQQLFHSFSCEAAMVVGREATITGPHELCFSDEKKVGFSPQAFFRGVVLGLPVR